MSEYTPITGELRAAMHQWVWVESDGSITFTSSSMPPSIDAEQSLAIRGSDFDRYCDAIDAVHAQLERENAALKSSAAHAYVSGYEYAEMDRDGWVELPKDMDGVPIHIGDVVEHNGVVANVLGITFHRTTPPTVCICRGDYWVEADELHHYVPDTWERIIEDAVNVHGNGFNPCWTDERDALVARCKALCERTKGDE